MSVAIVATLICVGASLMLWRGTPSGATPTPTTYADYAIYGENGVHIGVDSVVTGMVGARHNRTESPNPHEALHMNGGSEIHGDVRMGEDVDMQNATLITGALDYVGTLTKQASATIGTATQVLDAGLPVGSIPTQWPAPGAATYCATDHGNDINVANGQTITLTPGTWGTIHAGSNTDLVFNGAGDYFIDSLNVGSVDLALTPGMRVFVCNSFQLDAITSTPPASLTSSDVYVEVAAIPEDASHWGFVVQNGHWVGDVVVPTAGIHYGSGSSGNADIVGHLWAEHIDLEHDVTTAAPTTTTTTTTSVTSPSDTSTSTSSSSSTPTSSSSSTSSSTSTSTSTSTTTVTVPDTTTTTISNNTSTSVPGTTTTTSVPDTTVPDTTSTTIDNDSTTTITAAGSTTTSVGGDTTTTSGSQDTTSTTSGGSGPLPFTGSAPFAEIVVGLSCLTAGALLALRRRNAARGA